MNTTIEQLMAELDSCFDLLNQHEGRLDLETYADLHFQAIVYAAFLTDHANNHPNFLVDASASQKHIQGMLDEIQEFCLLILTELGSSSRQGRQVAISL